MNLLISLDLTYNPGKNFKFYSLQGQNFKIFLIFTYNQGKVFLILPITRGAHVYLVSIGSSPPLNHCGSVPNRSEHVRSRVMTISELAQHANKLRSSVETLETLET